MKTKKIPQFLNVNSNAVTIHYGNVNYETGETEVVKTIQCDGSRHYESILAKAEKMNQDPEREVLSILWNNSPVYSCFNLYNQLRSHGLKTELHFEKSAKTFSKS